MAHRTGTWSSLRNCTGQASRRLVIPVVLSFLLTGCLRNEITTLEYDRMTGTTLPPDQNISGTTGNIGLIYIQEGYFVDVEPDEANIAPLPGDGITDAELDALESGHRHLPVAPQPFTCLNTLVPPTYTTCMDYFVYGVVVNHYRELDDGTIDQTILGRMWTDENRRAFANFYRNTIVSTDGGKFLRSAAHELGHAFNMHHEDGDGYSSIMDQTGVVDDHYVYQFAAASHDHLRNHPVNCIQPGTGAFAFIDVNAGHQDHGYTTPGCQ